MADNPPDYTPPAPDTPPAPASEPTLSPSMGAREMITCPISQECRAGPDRIPLSCADGDFRCMCAKTQFLGKNPYFDALCVLHECPFDDAKRDFLRYYKDACEGLGFVLKDVPEEWREFEEGRSVVTSTLMAESSSSSSITSSSSSSESTTTSNESESSSRIVDPTVSREGTSRLSSTVAPTRTSSSSNGTPMPSITSSLADIQIPICGISQKCITPKPLDAPTCRPSDLDCICKADSKLEGNSEFDQQCVLDTCFGDLGKEEFLNSLIYHCTRVNKTLTNIPKRWDPYLPPSFSTSPPPTSPSTPTSSSTLSTGTIAGISLGSLLALALLIGLLTLYWRTKKKAHKLKVQNARLADETNPHGFARRITALMSGGSGTTLPETTGRDGATRESIATYDGATNIGSPTSQTAFPFHYPGSPREHKVRAYSHVDGDEVAQKDLGYGSHGMLEVPGRARQGYRDREEGSAYVARRPSWDEFSFEDGDGSFRSGVEGSAWTGGLSSVRRSYAGDGGGYGEFVREWDGRNVRE